VPRLLRFASARHAQDSAIPSAWPSRNEVRGNRHRTVPSRWISQQRQRRAFSFTFHGLLIDSLVSNIAHTRLPPLSYKQVQHPFIGEAFASHGRTDQWLARKADNNMVLHQPTAKVLVVEDEMMLRMRAVDIVEDAGFTPIEAVNGDDAFAILQSRSDIDLLLTDIQMPGTMDGLKLAHAVHSRWPSIKIMLVSGQVTPTETEKPVNSRFYGKPLEVKKMIAELQEMLGEGTLRIVPADISKLLAASPRVETPSHAGPAGSNIDTSKESLTAGHRCEGT
jgi:CheY-like chemotaxis protein